jgi:hypothetical protein
VQRAESVDGGPSEPAERVDAARGKRATIEPLKVAIVGFARSPLVAKVLSSGFTVAPPHDRLQSGSSGRKSTGGPTGSVTDGIDAVIASDADIVVE